MNSKIRILLIEDDEDDFVITTDIINELPYSSEVIWVTNYEAGLEYLGTQEVDFGLIDYRIGGGTGLEFLKAVKALRANAPLVLLTGVGDRDIDLAATEAGASDFIDKSTLSAEKLDRTIRYSIANSNRSLRALAEKSNLLRMTLEHTGAGIAVLDPQGALIEQNALFEPFLLTLRQRGQLRAETASAHAALDDSALLAQLVAEIEGSPRNALELQTESGRTLETRCTRTPDCGSVIFALDITDLKAQQRKAETYANALKHAAMSDALTGVANRRGLDEKLKSWAEDDCVVGQTAILCIDLDRFKPINDTLGHTAGDFILKHTASKLESLISEPDFVARIGGDEFVVACMAPSDIDHVRDLARTITRELAKPINYEGYPCRTGASVGLAFGELNQINPRDLLINADIALNRAKQSSRGSLVQFSKVLQEQIFETKKMADELLEALEKDEFFPVFQPQFRADTREFCGIESLARWRHPEHGVLSPSFFMQVADDIGIIGEIDRAIFRKATSTCREMSRQGIHIPKISFNVSCNRLRDTKLYEDLDAVRLEHTKLALELLESIYLDEQDDELSWSLDALRELDVGIEIDDFGTGRASIVGLTRIAPDCLKIDRQLVQPITSSENQLQLVQAIVDIGRTLDIQVTAEGVATMEHAKILRDIGCDTLQGFALGRPMRPDELSRLLGHGLAPNAGGSMQCVTLLTGAT